MGCEPRGCKLRFSLPSCVILYARLVARIHLPLLLFLLPLVTVCARSASRRFSTARWKSCSGGASSPRRWCTRTRCTSCTTSPRFSSRARSSVGGWLYTLDPVDDPQLESRRLVSTLGSLSSEKLVSSLCFRMGQLVCRYGWRRRWAARPSPSCCSGSSWPRSAPPWWGGSVQVERSWAHSFERRLVSKGAWFQPLSLLSSNLLVR
jgi:hypothetical protein